jgi:hypothetical protein
LETKHPRTYGMVTLPDRQIRSCGRDRQGMGFMPPIIFRSQSKGACSGPPHGGTTILAIKGNLKMKRAVPRHACALHQLRTF